MPDACADGSKLSRYPANTNILYLGLQVSVWGGRGGVCRRGEVCVEQGKACGEGRCVLGGGLCEGLHVCGGGVG